MRDTFDSGTKKHLHVTHRVENICHPSRDIIDGPGLHRRLLSSYLTFHANIQHVLEGTFRVQP